MEDKIANSIALHQMTVNELLEIKERVKNNVDDTVRLRIETRQIFRAWEPYIIKRKNKLEVSPRTMNLILDEAIRKEKEHINNLIDMEIQRAISKKKK